MYKPLDMAIRWWHGEPASHLHRRAGIAALPIPAPIRAAETPYLARLDEAGIPRTLSYPATTLSRMLEQTAARFGPCVALVYGEKTWTYRELLAQVNRMAGALSKLGVRRGKRVALILPNCPEFVFGFFALQKLGAVAVNLGPLMGTDDLREALIKTDCRVAIALDLQEHIFAGLADDVPVEHWIFCSLAGYQGILRRVGYQLKLMQDRGNWKAQARVRRLELYELMDQAPPLPPTVAPEIDDVAILQPTGGTTGGLKLVELSHRNLICNTTQISVWMNARAGQERILAALPMFHVYGLTTCLILPIYAGGRILLITRFNAGEALEMIAKYKPTVFPMAPAMGQAMLDQAEQGASSDHSLHHMRLCISGAAPLPEELAKHFQEVFGVPICEGYGLSEAGPVTHINIAGHEHGGSIGLPLPDTQCRIVDPHAETLQDVPPGETGELIVSGPQVMRGYFGDPQQTAQTLVQDGSKTWLRTGDLAQMDAEGYFQIVDRKKDMIIRSGLKVYPAKVERVLRMNEKVADAAVVGNPDGAHTEKVIAFVVPRDSADHATLSRDLKQLCRQHLAPYEVPAEIEFAASLPRSPLGKLLKRELRRPKDAQPPVKPVEAA